MATPVIPRKEIAEPPPLHLKEVDTKNSSASESWDIPEEGQSRKKHHLGIASGAAGWALTDRFDRLLPPHRRYFGRSRRTFLLILVALFLCLLALIIGLAVGLSKGSNKYESLVPQMTSDS